MNKRPGSSNTQTSAAKFHVNRKIQEQPNDRITGRAETVAIGASDQSESAGIDIGTQARVAVEINAVAGTGDGAGASVGTGDVMSPKEICTRAPQPDPSCLAIARTASLDSENTDTSMGMGVITLPETVMTGVTNAPNNLIGGMIKDVSKAINTTTLAGAAIGFGGFPTYPNATSTAATASATAFTSRAQHTTSIEDLTEGGEAYAGQLTTTKAITTAAAAAAATATEKQPSTAGSGFAQEPTAPLLSSQSRSVLAAAAATEVERVARTSVTVDKSKSSENKCLLVEATEVSNRRRLEANSTSPSVEQQTSTDDQLATSNWILKHQHLPQVIQSISDQPLPPGLSTVKHSREDSSDDRLRLSQKKAQLKAEFFKEPLGCQIDSSSTTLARKHQTSQSPSCGSKRALAKHHNLKLKISKTDGQPHPVLPQVSITEFVVAAPINLSLVTRRKLQLEQRFANVSPHRYRNLECVRSFPCVVNLVQKFDICPLQRMIVHQSKEPTAAESNTLSIKPDMYEQRHSPLSDEGCNLGQSPYSSDTEDNESIRTTSTTVERPKRKERVARSASSDSALGLEVDDAMDGTSNTQPSVPQKRRMTLTVTDLPLRPALLPLAEPTALPDTSGVDMQQHTLHNLLSQTTVPSKVLLEERVVELPDEPRPTPISAPCLSLSSSRRESAQSCGSDGMPTDCSGRRFVRTPSVVVSDYSDDVMCGITLEEIEYFRAQRMRRRHSSLDTAGTEKEGDSQSDVSAASSCSNLYYCGSTISALDGNECYVNGVRTVLERKASDCSTCSASGDEDTFTIPEQPEDPGQISQDLADLLAAQHLNSKQPKKVGLRPACGETEKKKGF